MTRSFYEITTPLSTVKKLHFVDWFTSKAINQNNLGRWTWTALSGTNSILMDDNVDGGLQIRSDGSSGNQATIGFDDNRQYAHDGSVCIAVTRSPQIEESSEGTSSSSGFNDDQDHSWDGGAAKHFAHAVGYGGFANFSMHTGNGSSGTYAHTDVPIDSFWHTNKIELTSSNCQHTFDGILKNSKTTNLPTEKLQPRFDMRDNTGGGVHWVAIRYMECYNT